MLPDFVFKFEPPAGASKIKVKEMRAANQSHKNGGKMNPHYPIAQSLSRWPRGLSLAVGLLACWWPCP